MRSLHGYVEGNVSETRLVLQHMESLSSFFSEVVEVAFKQRREEKK
jgi:hypothetical protein